MARPRKPPETAQRNAVKLNLTASEKAELLTRARAHGLPIATYLRRILFNRTVRRASDREAGAAILIIAEKLRRLGKQDCLPERRTALDQIQAEIEAVAERLVG
ncbi:MAG: plasmid mobilization protein [Stellaceae bacterium]